MLATRGNSAHRSIRQSFFGRDPPASTPERYFFPSIFDPLVLMYRGNFATRTVAWPVLDRINGILAAETEDSWLQESRLEGWARWFFDRGWFKWLRQKFDGFRIYETKDREFFLFFTDTIFDSTLLEKVLHQEFIMDSSKFFLQFFLYFRT